MKNVMTVTQRLAMDVTHSAKLRKVLSVKNSSHALPFAVTGSLFRVKLAILAKIVFVLQTVLM